MNSRLPDGKVDVRYVFLPGAGDEAYARLLPQLTPNERARADHYLLLKDRLAFSAGRVLVRKMLSQYGDEPPGGWSFVENAHGKPEILRLPGTPDLRFNLSHSAGIVVAAVSLARDVGVDVESIELEVDCLDLARTHFSTAEVELLEALPEQQRRQPFFALWTLKEAYTKARGTGLSIPLSEFSFRLDPPAISFSSQLVENPGYWSFWQEQPSPVHWLAVAAQRHADEELILRAEQMDLGDLF